MYPIWVKRHPFEPFAMKPDAVPQKPNRAPSFRDLGREQWVEYLRALSEAERPKEGDLDTPVVPFGYVFREKGR